MLEEKPIQLTAGCATESFSIKLFRNFMEKLSVAHPVNKLKLYSP